LSQQYTKRILIAGGGYAAIQAALTLKRLLKGKGTKIPLIDKTNIIHFFPVCENL